MPSIQKASQDVHAGRSGLPQPAGPIVSNEEIARGLDEIADILELQNENAFRIRAYRNAARVLRSEGEEISRLLARGGDPDDLPGIGADLAGQIRGMVESGHLARLEELRPKVPALALALCRLPGLGPKRAIVLSRELRPKPQSLSDILSACKARRVRQLRGFGPRSEKLLLENLKRDLAPQTRYPIAQVRSQAIAVLSHMRACPQVAEAEIAGSYRRCQETIGDLDILCASVDAPAVMRHFLNMPGRDRLLSQGETKASIDMRSRIQVDLRVVAPESYGAALLYFTGSKAHNIALRRMAQARGLKINEYGVFKGTRRIAGETETSVYAALGLPFIEPELREDRGEIAAAASGRLPRLVTRADLKGDLHLSAREGSESLGQFAAAAKNWGHSYIAIVDRPRRGAIDGHVDVAHLRRRMGEIDRLNARNPGIVLLKGVEARILRDGSLDLPDDLIEGFDLVIAALESDFDLPRAEQTARLVRAVSNPRVDIVAHATGRLLFERESCDMDLGEVMAAVKAHGCWLELGSASGRIDLDDVQCRQAKQAGIKISLASGASGPEDLDDMILGLGQARRSWLEPKDIVNTRSLAALRLLLARKTRFAKAR